MSCKWAAFGLRTIVGHVLHAGSTARRNVYTIIVSPLGLKQ